jgi:hypothetical protein
MKESEEYGGGNCWINRLPSKGLRFNAQKLPIAQTTSWTENLCCVARATDSRATVARNKLRGIIANLSE